MLVFIYFSQWYDGCKRVCGKIPTNSMNKYKGQERKIMKRTGTPGFISLVLILSILLVPIVKGQAPIISDKKTSVTTQENFVNSYYVEDLSLAAEQGRISPTAGLEREVEMLEAALASKVKDRKGTIVVDKYGSKRFVVIDNLALRLT